MLPEFENRLAAFAEVIVRVGVNLQPGQPLLLAEPYELQGVARSAEVIVDAVRAAAQRTGGGEFDVIWGDGARLRQFAERADWRGYGELVAASAARMHAHLASGGAFLFLVGCQPRLLDGLPADRLAQLQKIGWEHFGPVIQPLMQGASQWCLAPAPSPGWANAVFADLPSEQRLAALWNAVFSSLRVDQGTNATKAINQWQTHLAALTARRDALNAARHKTLRYHGADTDLTVELPRGHLWCVARQRTRAGVDYAVNLPTEEIFTAPRRQSAQGVLRVAGPVSSGGAIIEGIELEFRKGEVVSARAKTGAEYLRRLLDTDDGAARLGEVALVETNPPWQGRHFGHTLLDENARPHVALGESYPFCNDSLWRGSVNRSLIHLDLPLDAAVEFSD